MPVTLPPEELAQKLTLSGTEVGDITVVGGNWDNVYVGRVTKVEKHPNADRLVLATVELPDESLTVVCGAPNVAAGQMVPFAKVGARLIDGHTGELTTLKAAKIRGVVSAGMVCSEKELGVSDEHEEIMVLPQDAPLGTPLPDYMGDHIFDLELTPNRPDCMSMLGVAWEVGALTGARVSPPQVSYDEQGSPIEELATVEIADPGLCSRYTASLVTDLRVAPSPHWMQERLLAAGMRPINNVVDITNYVMLEYGQPLHAFDFDKVKDGRIIVRRARKGERLVSLDGEERALDEEMLAITDPRGPVGLAGVMGGANTEVLENTKAVLLESANFNNVNIRHTSTKLRLRSEASIRFDKGLSPELPLPALLRATQFLAELAGGTVAKGVIDVYPGKVERKPLHITSRRVEQVLGLRIETEKVAAVLESLGFQVEEKGKSEMSVSVPYWRSDITIEDDLVEEVARIIGYDQLPTTNLSGQIPHREPDRARNLAETIRDTLASYGLQEVINYSLTGISALEKARTAQLASYRPLKVANPMRPDQEYLRLSLRPGLLANVGLNEKHQEEGLRFFEIGKVY
ncbi:MAG: phenylalanine--tRNA ligase subunit beta, partial [Dehalococcoidia bacterium]